MVGYCGATPAVTNRSLEYQNGAPLAGCPLMGQVSNTDSRVMGFTASHYPAKIAPVALIQSPGGLACPFLCTTYPFRSSL